MEDAGMALQVEGDARARVEGSLYARAITNLLDNALRHGEPGGTIEVLIAETGDTVSVTVRNRAKAIPREALDHLFDRFYRADPSRTGSDQNHGLGLAIVKAIAQLHGGTVFAASADGYVSVGLRFPRVAVLGLPAHTGRASTRAGRTPRTSPQPSA
jgi:two-component system heavy metal sensor histidine kinase CusS